LPATDNPLREPGPAFIEWSVLHTAHHHEGQTFSIKAPTGAGRGAGENFCAKLRVWYQSIARNLDVRGRFALVLFWMVAGHQAASLGKWQPSYVQKRGKNLRQLKWFCDNQNGGRVLLAWRSVSPGARRLVQAITASTLGMLGRCLSLGRTFCTCLIANSASARLIAGGTTCWRSVGDGNH
jgi:hypothetical protein